MVKACTLYKCLLDIFFNKEHYIEIHMLLKQKFTFLETLILFLLIKDNFTKILGKFDSRKNKYRLSDKWTLKKKIKFPCGKIWYFLEKIIFEKNRVLLRIIFWWQF